MGVRYMQAWEERAMEREAGRKEGYESGQKAGHESGQQEGKEQMSQLILFLLKEERSEELEKVAKDPEYCKKLMKEYGLD
ncbi:MAG: hypothetical protein MR380_01030 [Lachnospiraceae bacterium]|nr:hypothetical protein [Lachnospiraceae bacterium]